MSLGVQPSTQTTAQGGDAVVQAVFPGRRVRKAEDGTHDVSDNPFFGTGFVRPMFEPAEWIRLLHYSTRLRHCVREASRTAVGLGLSAHPIGAAEGHRNRSRAAGRDVEAMQQLIMRPNPNDFWPFWEILYHVEYEHHGAGIGYLEVVEDDRRAGGRIVNLDHASTIATRVDKERRRYIRVLSTGQKVYCRSFGDEDPAHAFVDRNTGKFYAEWPKSLSFDRRGSALLPFPQFCPLDPWYGEPTTVPSINSVAGNYLREMWDVNFLQNRAHVPLAIVVRKGTLSPDTMEQIEAFMRAEGVGVHNAGRIMVLQPDPSRINVDGGLDIKLEELKMGIGGDAKFLEKGPNNDEIREAFGLSDISMGGGGANATTRNAAALRQVTQEHVIDPRTILYEAILNTHVAPRIGGGGAVFRFRRPANLDPLQQATIIQKLSGVLRVDDARQLASGIVQVDLSEIEGELGLSLLMSPR